MTEDFGAYHPGAAYHRPYLENMAAWRNQVASETGVSGYAEIPKQVQEDMEAVEDQWVEDPDHLNPVSPREYRFEDQQVVETSPEPEASEDASEETSGLSEDLGAAQEHHEELFDPAEHTAPVVLDHLKDASRAEVIRVLTAEKGGKSRKGILKLEAELLAQASE